MSETTSKKVIGEQPDQQDEPLGVVGSPSDTFESTVDILKVSEKKKLLGELAWFRVVENDAGVLVLGQITEIKTENRWHQEPSFRGIIKRHGRLPHLSGDADSRIAKINVQSSFISDRNSGDYKAHKLANSPSTGVPVKKMSNQKMKDLMGQYEGLVCLGAAYDTKVDVPFWLKHFGSPNEGGAGEAYHIGVFGRTGSGKTTTAANMILGYARHHKYMSILILDPQEQFYEDNNVLPNGVKFGKRISKLEMSYEKYKVPNDVALPNDAQLFSELLLHQGFIKTAFGITTGDKTEDMRAAIEAYVETRIDNANFKIAKDPEKFFTQLMEYFLNERSSVKGREPLYSVYSQKTRIEQVKECIRGVFKKDSKANKIWREVCSLFSEGTGKIPLKKIIKEIVEESGNVIVLNISGRDSQVSMDDLQTLYVKVIEDAIKEKGAELYSKGKQANCLVVLDEAHKFISTYRYDPRLKELTGSIIDAVRTTRKYGIGYMFITQTIDSLHEEIRRQIRIFAFGYGLTSGSEFSKIKDTINNDDGARFYRSFIDPSSNQKFPFMFCGPISPLSFTGAPLFLEMHDTIVDYPEKEPPEEESKNMAEDNSLTRNQKGS